MTAEETALLERIFDALAENDGTTDADLLDLLVGMSSMGKAEFVRRMDEKYGVESPRVH